MREAVVAVLTLGILAAPSVMATPASAATGDDAAASDRSARSDDGDRLRRVVVVHGRRAVRVVAEYGDLRRPETFRLRARLRRDGTWRNVRLGPVPRTDTAGMGCGMSHVIGYDKDTLRLRIPRKCGQRWSALRVRHAGSAVYLDNAL
jgi:hypothetical protein